ncbi:MAG: M23 family metallopeptidase [Pseudomonadota bacterium]|nr:M23 family metallopeptidase [Pseudomonadota bacterium]
MNLIFFSRRHGLARHLSLTHPVFLTLVGVSGLLVLGSAFALGMHFGSGKLDSRSQLVELAKVREQVQDRIDAISVRMGELNAHVVRLDALGRRLTEMAKISSGEFNFDSTPALGGPDEDSAAGSAMIPDLTRLIDDMERRLEQRDSQLLALENVILSRSLHEAVRPEGRPVAAGYVSSYFGSRTDPFEGHTATHKGLDFAGQAGSEVLAVAEGVVSRVEKASGYGNLVEIKHGEYVTRYAHNQKALVAVGDRVSRGQAIALMGSTGRSTGPHVHFEVLQNGRHVDPLKFIGK